MPRTTDLAGPTYEVWFNIDGTDRSVVLPQGRGTATAQEGFWVDVAFRWCVASESRYWVPPGRVLRVEKSWGAA
jgi:hypothetical protein